MITLSNILYPSTLFSDIFEQHHATNGFFLIKIKTKKKSLFFFSKVQKNLATFFLKMRKKN